MTIASRIAEWLAYTDLDSVPESIQARARLCCLDTVGVALAGLEAPSVHAAARAFASEGGYGFWSRRGSADLACACFVNATAASALDLDDATRWSSVTPPPAWCRQCSPWPSVRRCPAGPRSPR